jgi:hypothetical protein
MNRVFVSVSYEVFTINEGLFFTSFHKFIGNFQIEQTIEESLNKEFRIWFYTDAVEIAEGERRQVDITVTRADDGKLNFHIQKF